MAIENPRSQPSACIILGNPGVSHPDELHLREEIKDPNELNAAISRFYKDLKKAGRLDELILDPQTRAIQDGLEAARKIHERTPHANIGPVILLDVPRGLTDIDLIDPSRRDLPDSDPGKISHKTLRGEALPRLNMLRELVRETYRRNFQAFGLQHSVDTPALKDVSVVTKNRARGAILRMNEGKQGYPDISGLAADLKMEIVDGELVPCAGIFAGAIFLASRSHPGRTFGFWEVDGGRVKIGHIERGSAFATDHLGVSNLNTRISSSVTLTSGETGLTRGGNGWAEDVYNLEEK